MFFRLTSTYVHMTNRSSSNGQSNWVDTMKNALIMLFSSFDIHFIERMNITRKRKCWPIYKRGKVSFKHFPVPLNNAGINKLRLHWNKKALYGRILNNFSFLLVAFPLFICFASLIYHSDVYKNLFIRGFYMFILWLVKMTLDIVKDKISRRSALQLKL